MPSDSFLLPAQYRPVLKGFETGMSEREPMPLFQAAQYRPVLKGFETLTARRYDQTGRHAAQYRPVLKGFETPRKRVNRTARRYSTIPPR